MIAKLPTARKRATVIKDAGIIQALKPTQKAQQDVETCCKFMMDHYTCSHYTSGQPRETLSTIHTQCVLGTYTR